MNTPTMTQRAMPRHGQALFESGTGQILNVLTPEGVPLHFQIATAGARAGAVMIDYGLIVLSVILITLAFGISGVITGSGLTLALIFFSTFLLLNFYFTFFEVRWQGATPGKRITGIRVINRSGGPVTSQAILTRNFLRVIEVVVPLQMLGLFQSDSFIDIPWYLTLLGVLWAFVLTFLPLFNRQRLRLGDLAAGTVVVQMPKAVLLEDQGREGERMRRGRAAAYAFTREELDVYGEYELQVLEELLRDTSRSRRSDTFEQVAGKITTKIGYARTVPRGQSAAFLQAFYEALRAHRERRMLFGRRKQDKHARED